MLYIFLVDTGTMMQLEMDLALETVASLKGVIGRSCRIPPEKQVLLISGGDSLDQEERVCKYNAGTDTNPIFLFSMSHIESTVPPTENALSNCDLSIDETALAQKVESSAALPDTQSTVVVRSTLAQEYVRAANEQIRACENLIHDQHLQHQGWMAVIANLEDTATALSRRKDSLSKVYQRYLSGREQHRELVETFDDDVALLHQITVFPSLLTCAGGDESIVAINGDNADGPMSLLEWINSRGSSQSLEKVADSCYRAIEKMDGDLFDDLSRKVNAAIDGSGQTKMKEIRGLSERLQGLEQLLIQARKRVQEQHDLAAAFLHNQRRASGMNDTSILPDLCASHRQQLVVMSQNHVAIVSILKRIAKAKEELSSNLHHRMKWVVHVQNQMAEVGQLIVMHAEELRRLNRKLEAIEQIHAAPSIYIATAVEVVRRRAFAKHYLEKAGSLSEKFSALHQEEMALRSNFQSKLKKHFLSKMFPGMEDLPPPFATENPDPFDDRLPEITVSDVERLRLNFPDLAKSLQLPEEDAFATLLAKSINQTLTERDGETLFSLQNLPRKIRINSCSDIGTMSVMNRLVVDCGGGGGGGNGTRPKKKGKKSPSNNRAGEADSESDTDDNDVERISSANGKRYNSKRNKLTQSLPLEESALLTKSSALLKSSEFTGVDKSSSSADPSSSSGGVGGGNTSVAPSSSSDCSNIIKSAVDCAASAASSEEKRLAVQVIGLTKKLAETESSYQALKANLLVPSKKLSDLKSDLSEFRDKVLEDKACFDRTVESVNSRLCDVTLLSRSEMEKAVAAVRKEGEAKTSELSDRLDLELHKLDDCHSEIDIYRRQLHEASQEIDRLKGDGAEADENWRRELSDVIALREEEKESLKKKLMLDHEFEMESLREKAEKDERVAAYEKLLQQLREELKARENDVDDLKRRARMMENNQEEKFHSEKDKIVQILEAGFAQREKLALAKREEELTDEHEAEMEEANKSHLAAMEDASKAAKAESKLIAKEIAEQLKAQHGKKVDELKRQHQTKVQETIEGLQRAFSEEKEKCLKQQADKLAVKAKSEVESLRTKFKLMQNAGALDRSPSASESELSMSPRPDLIETIRSAIALEYDNNLKAELSKHEKKLEQLRQEHKEGIERERVRGSAEQQVKFNEALKKSMELKDAELTELGKKNAALEAAAAADGGQAQEMDRLRQMNSKLERDLSDLRSVIMEESVMQVRESASSSDLSKLQQENRDLKDQLLSQSLTSLVSSGSVNVNSLKEGDRVVVVWSETHRHYTIYNESQTYHFLHSDSVEALGLSHSGSKRYTTAEVVDKEYCQAKKAENRFKVPVGTKFYRVKCRPIGNDADAAADE